MPPIVIDAPATVAHNEVAALVVWLVEIHRCAALASVKVTGADRLWRGALAVHWSLHAPDLIWRGLVSLWGC